MTRMLTGLALLASVLLTACQNSAFTNTSQTPNPFLEARKTYEANLAAGVAQGKALVLMPVFDVSRLGHPPSFDSDYATLTRWARTDVAAPPVEFGPFANELFRTKADFYMYPQLVDPGTYRLQSTQYEAHKTHFDNLALTQKPVKGGVGVLELRKTTFTETVNDNVWHNDEYDSYQENVCTQVLMPQNVCISSQMQTNYVLRRQAGWYTEPVLRDMPGLYVTGRPSGNVAQFEVKAGEVVVLDGIYVRFPNTDYDDRSCVKVATSEVNCVMTTFQFQRFTAPYGDLLETVKASLAPEYRQLLGRAEHREVTVDAIKSSDDPTWYQGYYVGRAIAK